MVKPTYYLNQEGETMYELTNKEVAKMLSEYADLMKIKGENRYKIRAYTNAARKITDISQELRELVAEDNLQEIKGIGKGIATTIREIFKEGYCSPLEELKTELPSGVLELIKIPGLGPVRAHDLFYKLGIKDVEQLKEALAAGKVRKIKGFGVKTEEKLRNSLADYERYQGVIFIGEALLQSEKIIQFLREGTDIINNIAVIGDIRRKKEVMKTIDILIASNNPEEVKNYIDESSFISKIVEKDTDFISITTEEGLKVIFRIVSETEFPVSLQYFTGSAEHNDTLRKLAVKNGYQLKQDGLYKDEQRIKIREEKEIYKKLGLNFIIPELRENRGEIKAARNGVLPESIKLSDIKGDLHMHSRYSDGAHSIEALVKAACKKDYNYIAITDHSQSLQVAHGLSPETLLEEGKEIDKLQEKYNLKIFKGIEVDILTDGKLDYSDEVLSKLDLVIASIHIGLNQSKEKITTRIIKALKNPYVNILGHPQGRILGRRSSYSVDMDRVIETAVQTNTCLEINASPYRLDLDDVMVKKAREAGVKIVINTDAHHIEELEDMVLGIGVARRGWLEKDDVLNTMNVEQLERFFRRG